MFCARCGAAVEVSERTCATCGLDLALAGAVRLTDPRDAESWRHDRDLVVRPPSLEEFRLIEPAVAEAEEPTEAAADAGEVVVGQVDPQRRSAVFEIGHDDEPRRAWLPWVIGGLVVVALIALVSVTSALFGIGDRRAAPASTTLGTPSAGASTPVPPSASSGSSSVSVSASARPSAPPSFPANSKTCSDTVATSRNTSCTFAKAVGAALVADPKATMLKVTSPVSGRTLTLECVRDVLTTCKVGNITVYHRPA